MRGPFSTPITPLPGSLFHADPQFRPEQIAEVIDLNAISWVRVNRAVLPAMRRAGRGLLIYNGSGINRLPDPFTGPYAASKAAGDVLAEVMAFETARYGIETVIVQPGAYM